MQWHTQAGNITTNIQVEVDFNLPALRATNAVTWKYHMDDPSKGNVKHHFIDLKWVAKINGYHSPTFRQKYKSRYSL